VEDYRNYQELFDSVTVNPHKLMLSKMKSVHQRAFFKRAQLVEIGHTDLDLHYDAFETAHKRGKPYFNNTLMNFRP
jgi:hypothetical protein